MVVVQRYLYAKDEATVIFVYAIKFQNGTLKWGPRRYSEVVVSSDLTIVMVVIKSFDQINEIFIQGFLQRALTEI